MCDNTSAGRVFFVGAGPGAGDLITVRGAKRIGAADVVVWPSGVVAAEVVREHAAAGAELVDATRVGEEQLVQLYRRAAAQRSSVARLVPGDAAVWSGLQHQLDVCRRLGLLVEIVPGVAPLSAAVAATGRELAEPAVLLAQFDAAHPEQLTGTGTVAVTASASRTEALVAQLRAAGRHDDTPVVVAVKPSRPDELVLTTTLGELDGTVKRHRLWLPALFLIGRTDVVASGRPARGVRTATGVASRTAGAATVGSAAARAAVAAGHREASPPPTSAAPVGARLAGPAALPPAAPLHRPYRRRRRPTQGGAA